MKPGGEGWRASVRRSARSNSSMGSGFTDVLPQVVVGFGAKQLEPTLEVTLDGGEGCVERCGDLLGGHVFLIAEDDGGALGFGQRGKQLLDARAEGRGGIFAGDVVVIADFDPIAGAAHATATERIGAAADGDAAQPEEGVIGRVELEQVAIHFEKDILGDLFGEAAVAGDAQSEREDHELVLVDELFEVRLPARCHGERLLF